LPAEAASATSFQLPSTNDGLWIHTLKKISYHTHLNSEQVPQETILSWPSLHRYNNSQKARGIPDVSANGLNTLIAVGGKWGLTGGTSASAPIVGSIITLINEERIKIGKGRVGFINPVLYANPWALNDIVEGANPGCGTNGFNAVDGWDPVTGLGTLNFEELLRVWMALP
jgi:tripeptidyl-peptidase I